MGPDRPWGGPQTVVLQDPGNRARGQSDAELDQLALDAAVAPPRVLRGQTDDESGGLLVDRWATGPEVRISPAPSHEPTVPGEERLGRHREAGPTGAGEEPTQRGEEGTVGGLVGRTSELAPEHGYLVAQGQQLDVVRAAPSESPRTTSSRESADGKVCECPELAACPVPAHPATVAVPGMASPCSVVRSSFRIVRAYPLLLDRMGGVTPGPGWPPRPGYTVTSPWSPDRQPLWPGHPNPVQPVGRRRRQRGRVAPITDRPRRRRATVAATSPAHCHRPPSPYYVRLERRPLDRGLTGIFRSEWGVV